MLATIGRIGTIAAVCIALEFHWMALQSVAWTAMFVSNACHGPLKQAVTKTLDGSHPCSLCHAVSAGQKSQKKPELVSSSGKIDLFCTTQALDLGRHPTDYDYSFKLFRVTEYPFPPPVPPPRLIGDC